METDLHAVLATSDQEEAARQFERYDLYSAPVVDTNNRLVGIITVDDVVDVIQSEADEDMRALGGVGDESLADSVLQTAQSRVPWLIVNLGTAVLASFVIKAFDATIEQMVALAVLMPIVASTGGNAGTQTMTVTVRALATNKLGAANAPRIITRETVVGLVNGLILSVLMASLVFLWFGSGKLGAVIGSAMIVNLLAAALAGILIPLTLDRFNLDPAPASGRWSRIASVSSPFSAWARCFYSSTVMNLSRGQAAWASSSGIAFDWGGVIKESVKPQFGAAKPP
jgi:magnesium transporter